jgi:hypothetical protein
VRRCVNGSEVNSGSRLRASWATPNPYLDMLGDPGVQASGRRGCYRRQEVARFTLPRASTYALDALCLAAEDDYPQGCRPIGRQSHPPLHLGSGEAGGFSTCVPHLASCRNLWIHFRACPSHVCMAIGPEPSEKNAHHVSDLATTLESL